jgi:hypothetical protein
MRGGYDPGMALPVSILLIAVGAILAFAVEGSSSAVDINTVGWILMGAGVLGLVLSMILWDSWMGGRGGYGRRRTVVQEAAPPAEPAPRRTVVQEDVEEV